MNVNCPLRINEYKKKALDQPWIQTQNISKSTSTSFKRCSFSQKTSPHSHTYTRTHIDSHWVDFDILYNNHDRAETEQEMEHYFISFNKSSIFFFFDIWFLLTDEQYFFPKRLFLSLFISDIGMICSLGNSRVIQTEKTSSTTPGLRFWHVSVKYKILLSCLVIRKNNDVESINPHDNNMTDPDPDWCIKK